MATAFYLSLHFDNAAFSKRCPLVILVHTPSLKRKKESSTQSRVYPEISPESREGGARRGKIFTGTLKIQDATWNFWLFMFFYTSLSVAVTLVSYGCSAFKLVMVLLLTFGRKSKLLHILSDLSGVASSCELIPAPPPAPTPAPFCHTCWPGFTGCDAVLC